MTAKTFLDFRLAPIATVLLTVFGSAHAAEGDLKSKITSDSSISVGAGYVDGDNGNFGKYNGLDQGDGYFLLDGDIRMRDEQTGTWMRLYGRNLGLDTRELRWDYSRQGNFGYYLEYNEIPRHEPLTVVTPVIGIGSSTLTLGGAAREVDIESKRKRFSLGFDKNLNSTWGFNVDFRNEAKTGERIFGIGTGSNGQIYFTPEPLDSTINQIEATARYTSGRFHLVGGYYGTQYRNDPNALTVTYAGFAPASSLNPIALPPDNQSHKMYLSGLYSFSPTAQGTFKAAYTKAMQDDGFIEPTANGRADLGGKVETTLLQAGISARPMPKLSIIGNLRYEDRDDKTPVAEYYTNGALGGFNRPRSIENTSGKLEASYALPQGFRAIGAVEYDKKNRNINPYRTVATREETEEWSYRGELRRSMSETVMGGLSYTYSERDGSTFLPGVTTAGVAETDTITPLNLADRKRDKIRLSLTWIPVSPLSVQFYLDNITDRYDGQFVGALAATPAGPRKGEQDVYSVDVAYQFSTAWQVTAWYSYNDFEYNNLTPNEAFDTKSKNKADSFGLGLRGKPNERFQMGADLSYSDITDEWRQLPVGATPPIPAASDLPIAVTRLTRINLFGKYNVDKNSGVRLDYIFDRYSSDDPTWTGWTNPASSGYGEGTVISQPSDRVHFVGVRYFYKFQ